MKTSDGKVFVTSVDFVHGSFDMLVRLDVNNESLDNLKTVSRHRLQVTERDTK